VPETVVIVGAGHGAGQLVASLKHSQFAGRIVLIGDEPFLPYQRPPLSKKFLAGEMPPERLYFKPESFYDDPQIELMLGTRVEEIDRSAAAVKTTDGRQIGYDKLVLATGSRARRLDVQGANLARVHYLRSIQDVTGIRDNLSPGKSVAIIGAGYIGLEVAAVCCQRGLNVTVVEMADRVMSRVVSPHVSDYYQLEHTNRGVKLMLSTALAELQGRKRVRSIVMDDDQKIAADLVVIGVGIVPNIELAQAAALAIDDGILVDDTCRTSDPDIYAIGDCTRHPNDIYGRKIRLESVHNALEQAKTAASNICGNELHYCQVPWFWSDQFDLKLQIAGLSQDYDEVVLRGEPSHGSFACFYLRDGVLIAVDAINSPREFMQAKPLIADRARIDPDKLQDPELALKDLS
jgi:3-phenylpropionate/trans-cinnamate dioxygenase ferredoxin reductase subunit